MTIFLTHDRYHKCIWQWQCTFRITICCWCCCCCCCCYCCCFCYIPWLILEFWGCEPLLAQLANQGALFGVGAFRKGHLPYDFFPYVLRMKKPDIFSSRLYRMCEIELLGLKYCWANRDFLKGFLSGERVSVGIFLETDSFAHFPFRCWQSATWQPLHPQILLAGNFFDDNLWFVWQLQKRLIKSTSSCNFPFLLTIRAIAHQIRLKGGW